MNMLRLSFINFRNGFKSYLSLVLSLSFSILILFNFSEYDLFGDICSIGTAQ